MKNFRLGFLTKAIEPHKAYELLGVICNQMVPYIGINKFYANVGHIGTKAHIKFIAPDDQYDQIKEKALGLIAKYEECEHEKADIPST